MSRAQPSVGEPDSWTAWAAWADTLLAPMDLTTSLLHQVAEAGQRKWSNSSPLAPLVTPGQERWGETVVALRKRTGWLIDDSDGLPRTVHPSGRFFVIVSTGSNGVGTFGGCPTPRNGLGKVVRRIIDGEPTTPPMLDRAGNPVTCDLEEDVSPELWIFMTVFHGDLIYSELSRPLARNGDDIISYVRRIQLPPLPFNDVTDEPSLFGPDDGIDDDADVDIDVRPL